VGVATVVKAGTVRQPLLPPVAIPGFENGCDGVEGQWVMWLHTHRQVGTP
jgi:hypothetical protein